MSENKFKKLLAGAMIVGALGFSSLGAGGGIANAKPHGPGIPWIPGPGYVGNWHPGKWLPDGPDVGDWGDVGDWWQPGEVAQNWTPWGWGPWQGDQGENEQ